MDLKKLTLIVFMIAILSATFITASGQTRISFTKGKNSAKRTGKIAAGARICYFIRAKSGTKLTVSVNSINKRVNIFESGEPTYSEAIDATGDHSICVDNLGRATRYSLVVTVL